MKYVDEYRDGALAKGLAAAIAREADPARRYHFMEFCGGHTHAISRYGVADLLPANVRMIHGPGCPVCVLPIGRVDQAIRLALDAGAMVCTYGDCLRVPASGRLSLLKAKARGGDVRMVYSSQDAVNLARQHPDRQVVFFAVGFETTAPGNAMAVVQARRAGLANFSLLVSHVLVPPALEAILGAPGCRVQGLLAAGHVCAVTGYREYRPIAAAHHVPIVVTGFEPLDILHGIYRCLRQLERGRAEVENQYARVVREDGNQAARSVVSEVFTVVPRAWRGIGEIPASGLALRDDYAAFDAERRFDLGDVGQRPEPAECMAGLVLQGLRKPPECPAFGGRCTPDHPLGATMVSSEGACSAYFHHRRALAGEAVAR
jgi:hydrogenase expression/formation protein HypD